jgi:DNA (cytosine-5)-methyltransferase 1
MLRALDMYCGAGGATRGLQRAGFHVTGIDLKASPRYCGNEFWHMDVLDLAVIDLWNFDFIWASPPCQAHTSLKTMHNAKQHVDLISDTRHMLAGSGRPFVIENVVGAPLINPFRLRGTMFGLGAAGAQLLRDRIFETSFPVGSLPPDERDSDKPVIGIYGGHYRNRRRGPHGPRNPGEERRNGERGLKDFTAADGREAMQIDWMTGNELSQAIPPAYSHWIAEQWLSTQRAVA